MRWLKLFIFYLRLSCLLFAINTVLPNTTIGATYYLDVNTPVGGDGGAGTSWVTAKKTLSGMQTLLNALADKGSGDTVDVNNGSYGEYSETLITRTDRLTYQAAEGKDPIFTNIKIYNPGSTTYDAYLVFDGITVQPTDSTRGIQLRRSAHTQFLNLNIDGPGVSYNSYAVHISYTSTDITIDGCTISGGTDANDYAGFRYGIYITGNDEMSNIVINNNEIKQFYMYGIYAPCSSITISSNNIHRGGGDAHLFIGVGEGPMLVEGNRIYDLQLLTPELTETPTETIWSEDGTTMTNSNATWGVDAPYSWVDKMKLYVLSGNNANTADIGNVVQSVTPSQIVMKYSIKLDPNGSTPSNVNYYFKDGTHGDLIQAGAPGVGQSTSNLTIRKNVFYGRHGQMWWVNTYKASNPPSCIGGYNFTIENNLCYNQYTDATDEYSATINVSYVDGVVIRNNTFIGRGYFMRLQNAQIYNNIVSYLAADPAGIIKGDYNIVNRGYSSYVPGSHDFTFTSWGCSCNDDWNNPNFYNIFANSDINDFSLASSSTAIDSGDPMNYPTTDILGHSRDSSPDAGCYEYGSSEPNGYWPSKPIGDKTVNENEMLSFIVNIQDSNDPNRALSAKPLPGGATFEENTFSWTPTYNQAGNYDVNFILTEGEIEDVETITITVNNVNRKPEVEHIGNKTVNENTRLTFTVNAADPDGDSVLYAAYNLPTGSTFNSRNFDWNPGYNQAGSYIMSFVATDGELEDVESVIITVNNVNRAPVLSSIGNKLVNEGTTLTFAISASDADGDTITYSAQSLPAGAGLTGNIFTWTPSYNQAGSYQVTFIAGDGQSTDSEAINITVSNVNRTPTLASIGNKAVKVNKTLSFTINASDADGDAITYTAQNLPAGAVFSDNRFTWTPTQSQAGNYQVTFIAGDGQSTDSETITITVSDVETTPVLAPIGNKSIKVNETLSFTIDASDADGDAITYSVQNAPAGATFSGNGFTWTPTQGQEGSCQVTFIASDGQGTDSETITITVNVENRQPVMDEIGDKSVKENRTLTFKVKASDLDGDTLIYTAQNVPDGATFNGSTFTWEPWVDQQGSYQVTFVASDGYLEDSKTITITVEDVILSKWYTRWLQYLGML